MRDQSVCSPERGHSCAAIGATREAQGGDRRRRTAPQAAGDATAATRRACTTPRGGRRPRRGTAGGSASRRFGGLGGTGRCAFDLVVAATAWHWIDLALRYEKAWRLLRPGGHLAYWSATHVFPDAGDPFFREIQEIYEEIGEDRPSDTNWPKPSELPDERARDQGLRGAATRWRRGPHATRQAGLSGELRHVRGW